MVCLYINPVSSVILSLNEMHQEVDIKTIWLSRYYILKLKHVCCMCVCVCVFCSPIGVEASETLRAVLSNPLHAAFL